jgi:hypothetical protein
LQIFPLLAHSPCDKTRQIFPVVKACPPVGSVKAQESLCRRLICRSRFADKPKSFAFFISKIYAVNALTTRELAYRR